MINRRKLMKQAMIKYILGLFLVAVLLFLPAGTVQYWNGWLFIGVLFMPMFFLGLVLLLKAPELLEKRLDYKESEKEQKKVIGASSLMFLAGFIISSLDFRFGWSNMPGIVTGIAVLVFLAAYGLYVEVLRENAYLSRTVEVQEGQGVISKGLYGIVRHPMYFSTVLLFLSMPLILGSYAGFVIFLMYPFLLVKRIRNEESVLEKGLDGYKEYKEKVRYRMIPFIW